MFSVRQLVCIVLTFCLGTSTTKAKVYYDMIPALNWVLLYYIILTPGLSERPVSKSTFKTLNISVLYPYFTFS